MSGLLSVESLGKAYRIYPSRWARLAEWIAPGTPRHQLQ
jgi:lipopolysaccharide transport system ATP-binding protein